VHIEKKDEGVQVWAGTVLGVFSNAAGGTTGNSTGPHVHWEIRTAAGCVYNPDSGEFTDHNTYSPHNIADLKTWFVDPHTF
jgi:murein DD-endopeptidase MepM/ murein hydrolase activator NlpD